jgi:hypothetical protein
LSVEPLCFTKSLSTIRYQLPWTQKNHLEEVPLFRQTIAFSSVVEMRVTTHDVLTYSAKARKHKQVYPYLRYGLVASEETTVPGRVFTHNESLDFCMSLGALPRRQLGAVIGALIKAEVGASRKLEKLIFGKERVWLFRREVLKR